MFDLVPFGKEKSMVNRDDFFNQMVDKFFNEDFFAPFSSLSNSLRVDLKETEAAYQIEADLPGISKNDISLQYANNYLTITAKRQDNLEEKADGKYLRRERRYGEFQRSFYVSNVQDDKITAEFKDGVLKVTLPKQDKDIQRTNTITIQ